MKKALGLLMILFFTLSLMAQEDYYFDKQNQRILFYQLESIERKAVKFDTLTPVNRACYNWFKNQQQTNGLIESYEGGEVSYTYDDALAALVFTLDNNLSQVKKIFDFYKKERKRQIRDYNKFNGFADMYNISGEIGCNSRAVGPNAWLLLAINYYTLKFKDKKYINLARTIAEWILEFQDKHIGGIWGGINEKGSKFLWISTEHNLDVYAAFKVLYGITGERKYINANLKIKEWLEHDMWNKWTKRFYNGLNDPNYATDVSSWAVLSLLDSEYFPTLDFAIKYSENKQLYKPNEIEITGFDFGSSYAKTPYPDKDAVWFEGTGQMVLAFYLANKDDEAEYYLKELKKAVVRSEKHDDSVGLPYASNPGSPPYGGWVMPDKPICVSSTAWFLFALKKFNPFYGDFIDITGKQKIIPQKIKKIKKTEKKIEKELFEDSERESKSAPQKPEKKKKIDEELFGE